MNADSRLMPRRALGFANIGHFLNHVIMLIYPTIALTLADIWKISYGELFKLFFIGSLLYGVAALPAGWLGDRWSSWWMLAIYLIGTGVATFLTGFANSPLEISFGLGTIGLFAAIYHPVGTNFVVQHSVNRAKALGFNGAFGTFGLAAAALVSAGLCQLWGWRAAFFIPGAICLLVGFCFVMFTERNLEIVEKHKNLPGIIPVKLDKSGLALSLVAITALSVGLIAQAYTTGLPKIFDDSLKNLVSFFSMNRKSGLTLSSSLVTVVLLAGVIGQLLGGYLASRYSPKAVYIGMFSAVIPLMFVAAHLKGVPLVVIAALMMVMFAGCLPAENCIIVRFCPEHWRARAFSAKFVIALGGGSFANLAVGEIFDRVAGEFWFFAFLLILAVVVIAFGSFIPSMKDSLKHSTPIIEPAE